MYPKLGKLVASFLEETPLLNRLIKKLQAHYLQYKVNNALEQKSVHSTWISSTGRSVTSLPVSSDILLQNSIEEAFDNCSESNLKPIYNALLSRDKLLAEMFLHVISDEYDADPNARSAYRILYRDLNSFRELETVYFDKLVEEK
jgi:hypothetical protein